LSTAILRPVRFAEFYRDVAAAAIRRGEDVDGEVWVRESDELAAGARADDPGTNPFDYRSGLA
jgi:hypothetical protein